jgi:1-acyl-sn-glycerol-3-phosphate acyltransferase
MSTFEKELKNIEPVIRTLTNIALLGKRVIVKKKENFIKTGPNIIVGNHIGTFKDVATIFRIVPRPIFFTANKMIFDRDEFNMLIRKYLQRHLKKFGLFIELLLNPLKNRLVNYITENIGKIGTIPVDIYHKKRLAIEKCQEYVQQGRAIIALQGRGWINKNKSHPYVSPFRRGPSIISYNIYKESGLSVPVTPVALLGTHIPFLIPGKIKVSVGEPMFIQDYMVNDFTETVIRFSQALERRVKGLINDLIKS